MHYTSGIVVAVDRLLDKSLGMYVLIKKNVSKGINLRGGCFLTRFCGIYA